MRAGKSYAGAFAMLVPGAIGLSYIMVLAPMNAAGPWEWWRPGAAIGVGLAALLVSGAVQAMRISDGPCPGCCERDTEIEKLREAITR